MNKLKNITILSATQRKILAVLMLAITMTNAHVTSTAFAADPNWALPFITADQTDESETIAETQPTVQDVLLDVCQQNGYGTDCAKTLLGMLWNESSNRSTVIGDHGAARGYFQIHYKLHNISIACAEDLVCSSNWTINYMEAHSYPKYTSYAIQCHNSCGVNNGYAAKAVRNAKLMWNKPLAVTQDAPIQLAMK